MPMDQDGEDGGDGEDILLTGSDALRFLCSNCAVDREQACVLTESNVFSRLYTGSTVQARETAMATSPTSHSPFTSLLCASPRKQRKSYKPARVPPLEEGFLLHPKSALTDSPFSFTTMSNGSTAHAENFSLVKRKPAISGESPLPSMNGCHANPLSKTRLMKGKCSKKPNQKRSDGTVVCGNLACKAILHAGSPFCRRCSCCICMEFDDNKDPSLWITCDADEEEEGGCGLSCHMECALREKVAGVSAETGSPILFDGGFFCRSCGKISSIIGLWKKQLLAAKNARRVDVFCHRLFLSHRLLEGTVKYKDSHTLIDDAKKKLQTEVGLMTQYCSANLERCIVNRLSCNLEVQDLIGAALERVMGSTCETEDVPNQMQLNSFKLAMENTEKGSRRGAVKDSTPVKTPSMSEVYEGKLSISSVDEMGDVGTGITIANGEQESLERDLCETIDPDTDQNSPKDIADLGLSTALEYNPPAIAMAETAQKGKSVSCPSLAMEPFYHRAQGSKCSHPPTIAMAETAQNGKSVSCPSLVMEPYYHRAQGSKPMVVARTRIDGGSDSMHTTVIDGGSDSMHTTEIDDGAHSLEFSIRVVRWLEREGHLDTAFRAKFLTWYGLRATDHEKRVVRVFIDTLQDSAASLAAQLVDTFGDAVDTKRRRTTAEIGHRRRRCK